MSDVLWLAVADESKFNFINDNRIFYRIAEWCRVASGDDGFIFIEQNTGVSISDVGFSYQSNRNAVFHPISIFERIGKLGNCWFYFSDNCFSCVRSAKFDIFFAEIQFKLNQKRQNQVSVRSLVNSSEKPPVHLRKCHSMSCCRIGWPRSATASACDKSIFPLRNALEWTSRLSKGCTMSVLKNALLDVSWSAISTTSSPVNEWGARKEGPALHLSLLHREESLQNELYLLSLDQTSRFPVGDLNNWSTRAIEPSPERRITAIPPTWAVEMAVMIWLEYDIVSEWICFPFKVKLFISNSKRLCFQINTWSCFTHKFAKLWSVVAILGRWWRSWNRKGYPTSDKLWHYSGASLALGEELVQRIDEVQPTHTTWQSWTSHQHSPDRENPFFFSSTNALPTQKWCRWQNNYDNDSRVQFYESNGCRWSKSSCDCLTKWWVPRHISETCCFQEFRSE